VRERQLYAAVVSAAISGKRVVRQVLAVSCWGLPIAHFPATGRKRDRSDIDKIDKCVSMSGDASQPLPVGERTQSRNPLPEGNAGGRKRDSADIAKTDNFVLIFGNVAHGQDCTRRNGFPCSEPGHRTRLHFRAETGPLPFLPASVVPLPSPWPSPGRRGDLMLSLLK
jgi:hypothetical protein